MSRSKASSKARKAPFPYSEAEIERALVPWRHGALPVYQQDELKVTDPDFEVIIALAWEGAKHILSRRAGGRTPRKSSATVLRRMVAILNTYRDLPASLQAHPNGTRTIEKLRQGAVKELGLNDDDISEDIVRHDVRELSWHFQKVREAS